MRTSRSRIESASEAAGERRRVTVSEAKASRARRTPSESVECAVVRDPEDPCGLRATGGRDALAVAEGREEGLLQQVVGERAVARDLDEVAADPSLVGAEELLEAGVEQHAAVEIGREVALVDGELIHYFMTCRRGSNCDIEPLLGSAPMQVRRYEPRDEQGWVRCRVLSFLDTAYFDDVERTKPRYSRPAVELVAEIDGSIAGVIDVELDTEANEVASDPERIGAVIWTIAVHPDHQRKGVGGALLAATVGEARRLGAAFLEAWTRDDAWVRAWYEKSGFDLVQRYLHVYLDGSDAEDYITAPSSLRVITAFAHAEHLDELPDEPNRVHECVRYVLELG